MSIRLQTVAFAALAGVLAVSGARASESPYYKNVSDVEVETAVKGETYDKGTVNYPDHPSKKDCCCACQTATATPRDTVPASAEGSRIKYILDGKPVYEEGTAPAAEKPVEKPAEKAKATSLNESGERIKAAIAQLGTSGWQDAQTLLVESGKAAVPYLIDALTCSDSAYNLGGHTKADAGRAPRQRTVAEVAAELLTDIVSNHSSFKGELPAADQDAWRAWWSKNAEGVTFAAN